jgi:repressor LexA
MRSKSPELMDRISRYVGDYYREHREAPTTREIAAEVGMSPASGYNYLVEMDRRGMLTYENGRITGLPKMEKTSTGYFSAPLVGSIRCGDPETEEEQVEMYVSLPESLFGTGQCYLLHAVGDSMTDKGIDDGDLVLVRKQTECRPGDVVVAMDGNGENTLKVYGGTENGKAVLKYANEAVYPGKRILVDTLVLQGVAKRVIKEL